MNENRKKIDETIAALCDYVTALTNSKKTSEASKQIPECAKALAELITARAGITTLQRH